MLFTQVRSILLRDLFTSSEVLDVQILDIIFKIQILKIFNIKALTYNYLCQDFSAIPFDVFVLQLPHSLLLVFTRKYHDI